MKIRVYKLLLTSFILIISLILFISVFTRFYFSELRYIYHLFYGFGGCISVYFISFIFIRFLGVLPNQTAWNFLYKRFSLKWEWFLYFLAFLLIVGFDIYWQFFNTQYYNSDSALQFAFTILGTIFFPKYIEWFWKDF